jgi:signal transduction histidine kinase/ligand-binding sensor domain-containing protein
MTTLKLHKFIPSVLRGWYSRPHLVSIQLVAPRMRPAQQPRIDHHTALTFLLSALVTLLFYNAISAAASVTTHTPTPEHTERTQRPRVALAFDSLRLVEGTDIRFSRLSTAQGLSQTRVTNIAQDKQGFMWFATQYGLDRFDGYAYKVFLHDHTKPDSVSCDYIRTLLADHEGTLWVGCDEVLDRYDPTTETFQHFVLGPDRHHGVPVHIFAIDQDRTGMLWLSTNDGLFSFDPHSGATRQYRHDPSISSSLSSNAVEMLLQDNDYRFWVSDGGNVEEFDPKTARVLQRIPVPRAGPQGIRMYLDRFNVFWVLYSFPGKESGVATLDRKTGKLTRYSIIDPTTKATITDGVYSAVEDQNNTLWLGGLGSGLFKFDRQHSMLVRYKNNPGDLESLSDNRIIALCADRVGNVWVGLHAMEPNFFSSAAPTFSPLLQHPNNSLSRGESFIDAIFEDSHGVWWVSTTGALASINRETGKVTYFHPIGPEGYNDILAIAEAPAGDLWLGTFDGGLERFSPSTGKVTTYRHDPANPFSISNDVVTQILKSRDGTLWITTWNGLDHFDPTTNRFTVFKQIAGSAEHYHHLAEDFDGTLWLAGTAGLAHFNPATGTFKVYSHVPGDRTSLSDDTVAFVAIDHTGGVWATTTANGLNHLQRPTQNFKTYYTSDGLSSNDLSCILEDARGQLWMSSTRGISRFDPESQRFQNYSTAEGIPGPDLTGWEACYKGQDGRMAFGGFSGGVTFDPAKVVGRMHPPPIVFTDFQLSGHSVEIGAGSVLKHSVDFTQEVVLRHSQNAFSISFAALSFVNANSNRYRYRLGNFDDHWIEVGSDRRVATYTTLPSGTYDFVAQVETRPGVWSEPGTSLTIKILPPWWSTLWFRVLVFFTFGCAFWTLYYLRLRQAAWQIRARIEERVGERERIARELHDTLLQSIQGLLLSFQAVADRVDQSDPTRQIIEQALDRAEAVIVEGRDRVRDLRNSPALSATLPGAFNAAWSDLAANTGVTMEVVSDGAERELNAIVRDEAFWIGREAIVNALRHAKPKRIDVTIHYTRKQLALTFRDDGCGIDPSILAANGRGSHWGLVGMRERAKRTGGTLSISSHLNTGTTVELKIPGKIAYKQTDTME